jgi:hypothetical protein
MHVGGIFCDLAKASDCVNHDINFHGIKGKGGQWFKSHLNGRKQRVEILLIQILTHIQTEAL